jgi:hypothetical protein
MLIIQSNEVSAYFLRAKMETLINNKMAATDKILVESLVKEIREKLSTMHF